jgi:hypothetical protein
MSAVVKANVTHTRIQYGKAAKDAKRARLCRRVLKQAVELSNAVCAIFGDDDDFAAEGFDDGS